MAMAGERIQLIHPWQGMSHIYFTWARFSIKARFLLFATTCLKIEKLLYFLKIINLLKMSYLKLFDVWQNKEGAFTYDVIFLGR